MIETKAISNEELLLQFEAKIEAEQKIEPVDWLPDEYRNH